MQTIHVFENVFITNVDLSTQDETYQNEKQKHKVDKFYKAIRDRTRIR